MLAVVIPYFKADFFVYTLQSLANQTDKNFNIYIGDDASAENPSSLIEKYGSNLNIQYRRFSSNLGNKSLAEQWERCMKLIGEEDWVMFLGDDDVLSPMVVEEFNSRVNEITSDVVRFATYKINAKGEKISHLYTHPNLESSVQFFFRDRRSSLSEYVFKRRKLEQVRFKPFPLGWCSDILAVLEVSGFGTVYSINDTAVNIRISSESISGNGNNLKEKNQASEFFLKYLIYKKFLYFKKKDRLNILYKYEVALKKNRFLNLRDWWSVIKLYLVNFKIIPVFKLFRRIFIYYFSKNVYV